MDPDALAGLRPLDFTSRAYMDAHLNFRRRLTDQGERMQHYLETALERRWRQAGRARLRLLSIGSGTGIIDAPLVARLQASGPVSYLGIEPNAHEVEMARGELGKVLDAASTAEFFTGLLEDFELAEGAAPFDAAIAVHVTYYSADVRPMIERALGLLRPDGGVLVTLVSANTPQNELFRETTQALHGFDPCMSAAYRALLDERGVAYDCERIEARIDVTDFMADPHSPRSQHFLDFFLHADASSLPAAARARYVAVLCDAAQPRDGRMIMPHVVDAVTAYAR